MLDGHNNLVTPDPVPNSEVKLVMFVFVLSLMGRYGAVYLFFNYRLYPKLILVLDGADTLCFRDASLHIRFALETLRYRYASLQIDLAA